MFSMGWSEILLIGLVLLVFVGPDRLPLVLRSAGRIFGQLRRAADELRRAFVLEADRQELEKTLAVRREALEGENAHASVPEGSVAQQEPEKQESEKQEELDEEASGD